MDVNSLEQHLEASKDLATDSAEYFDLTKERARTICHEIEAAVRSWRQVAKRAGATNREIDELESAFD